MKVSSISELKKELVEQDPERVLNICIRLAKFEAENKELLDYLLFFAEDEDGFVKLVIEEIDSGFAVINTNNVYWAKKSLRKILKTTNKYIRFSGNKQTEVELLLHYYRRLLNSGVPIKNYIVLTNLANQVRKKIDKALAALHEDLRYDYEQALLKLVQHQ